MSGGHEQAKELMVGHLDANISAWLGIVRGAGVSWPPSPPLVAASDILPEKDELWPCVLVSSTRMRQHTLVAPAPSAAIIADYDMTITVAARAVKEADIDSAVDARDRLLLAVRWLLLAEPGLSADARVLATPMPEETAPLAVDAKGRPVAMGTITVQVRVTETIPDPAAFTVDEASVEINASDAAETGTVTVPTPPPPSE